MKKILALSGAAAVLIATSLPAYSLGSIPKNPPPGGTSGNPSGGGSNNGGSNNGGSNNGGTRPSVAAPEIDASAGAKGLAVLVAGLLIAAERLRRR